MKEGDLILVSAEATGLGKPMEAIIDKIETFMGQTLVTVTYTQPNALSGFGGYFVDSHITLSEDNTIFPPSGVYLKALEMRLDKRISIFSGSNSTRIIVRDGKK